MEAVLELDKAIQTVVATLANIEELRLEQGECVKLSRQRLMLLYCQWGLGKAKYISWHPSGRSWKYSNPIVANADWLKAGQMV